MKLCNILDGFIVEYFDGIWCWVKGEDDFVVFLVDLV